MNLFALVLIGLSLLLGAYVWGQHDAEPSVAPTCPREVLRSWV